MRAIEFKTNVVNGMVKIPQEYNLPENHAVRIIVLTEDGVKPSLTDRQKEIELLLERINNKGIFDGIKDPVAWQQQLRSEWGERSTGF